MKPALTCLFIFLFASMLFSQEDPENKKIIIKTEIANMSTNFFIDHYVDGSLKDSDSVSYMPDSGNYWGIEAYYNGIGFGFMKQWSQTKEDKDLHGISNSTNIFVNFFNADYGVDIYFQKGKGYSLEEPDKYGLAEGNLLTKRDDLGVIMTGINGYFNICSYNNYSLDKGFQQIGVHDRFFAAGLIVMLSANYFNFDSNYSLVPLSLQSVYGSNAELRAGEAYLINISPGVGLSLTLFDFYISPSILIGGGPIHYEYKTGNIKKSNTTSTINRYHMRLNIGYEGENILWGVKIIADGTNFVCKDIYYEKQLNETEGSKAEISVISFQMSMFAGIKF